MCLGWIAYLTSVLIDYTKTKAVKTIVRPTTSSKIAVEKMSLNSCIRQELDGFSSLTCVLLGESVE